MMTKQMLNLNADWTSTTDEEPRGLAAVLASLIARAEHSAGKFHETTLKHGLQIEISIGEVIGLRLSRAGVAPSLNEWQTIIRYLPAIYKPVIPIEPLEDRRAGRVYLEESWYYQQRLL